MGLFDLFGIHGAIAPISSFIEMVKSLRGNWEDKNEWSDEDIVIDDNQKYAGR